MIMRARRQPDVRSDIWKALRKVLRCIRATNYSLYPTESSPRR